MRTVFLGTGDIGLPTLTWLIESAEHEVAAVVTQPDKPQGRHQVLTPSPIKRLAVEHGIPVLQPVRMRQGAAVAELRAYAPELIVVMAYGQILPPAVLEMPPLACLNLHASLLPRHRGAAPIQAAIEAGDASSGITVMYMAEGLDTGDILLKRETALAPDETGGSLHDRLGLLARDALADALPMLARSGAPREPQQEAAATYAAKLTREHGEIRWSTGWQVIERKIRAMNPWPTAFTSLPTGSGPRKLKIFAATPIEDVSGAPGEVHSAVKDDLIVGTGDGALRLAEIQLEGKRRMSAREFLAGHPIAIGTQFGNSSSA